MAGHASGTEQRLVVDRHVPCRLRDGVVLRADVYRPEHGPSPVLVHRIPYGRQNPMAVTNSMFPPIVAASRGYAVVVQDTRGRFDSEGAFEPFHQEAADGYDTIEWAAEQPWSDGNVGIYGSSYMGVTALQAVAAAPPHLRTAIAYLTGGDYHDGWVYTGGAFELLFNLRWTAGAAASELRRAGLDAEQEKAARERLRWIAHSPASAVRSTPVSEIFGSAAPAVPFWERWMQHPDHDEYWEPIDLTTTLAGTRIPVLNVAGWYDPFLAGQLRAWDTLSATSGDDVGHRLMVGPWDHQAYQSVRGNAAGDRFFGPEAVGGASGFASTFLDWFDQHLRGERASGGREGPAPIRYFHMGPNRWEEASQWPPDDATTVLYLRSAGMANSRSGNGSLAPDPGSDDIVDSYTFDPRDPVPTCGGRHLGFWYGPAGVQDQSEVELRDDVLVYTGPQLVASLDVTGAVRVDLHVRSSAISTDFTGKLVDVGPDGYCANVAEGIVRVGPDGHDLRDDLPRTVHIDLWDTAYRFEVGHRVRLEVSSSNFPRFSRNGGLRTRPELSDAAEWTTATQEIWCGPSHPSRLSLGGRGSGR